MDHIRHLRLKGAAIGALMALGLASGCPRTQTADEGIDNSLKQAGISRDAAYPLAGKVTIDGQPPQLAKGMRLVIMLNEPGKLDLPSLKKTAAQANAQGEFAFGSYKRDDGVKPGKYILTFAVLRNKNKVGLLGPDQLKNVYNDPEKNEKVAEFNIDHQPPGKKDYVFNLDMTGKAESSPGPHALTDLVEEAAVH